MKREVRRDPAFQAQFVEDLKFWIKSDRSTTLRVLDLADAVIGDPFEGLGKPEPLKHELVGCWARRITQEHRLVYRVTDKTVEFLQARYHY